MIVLRRNRPKSVPETRDQLAIVAQKADAKPVCREILADMTALTLEFGPDHDEALRFDQEHGDVFVFANR